MLEKLKKMRKNDYKHLLKLIISLIPGTIFRVLQKDIWLISERENDAKDNGYYLFKYIMDNGLKENVFYAINKKSNDYKKISKFDKNIIQFGSLKHHIYTWACNKNISSQVGSGLPNRICYTLQMKGIYKFKSVFLQHGITKDKVDWLQSSKNKIDLFCCVSEREREFVVKELGYDNNVVKNIGFCRYDGLITEHGKRQILFMPTWRKNLVSDNKEDYSKYKKIFIESDYYNTIIKYINNEKLINFLEENNYKLILYLHDNIQIYIDLFKAKSENIIIANKKEFDIQKLMKESEYLITDYSSIAFDFAYMKKPLQYFQFDINDYRENHYQQGYFNYDIDGFGKIITTKEESIKEIIEKSKENFEMENVYQKRVNEFFKHVDYKNCERTYREIYEL